MTQPAFTKMYLKGKQPLFGYTVNSNGTEAAVAQAQPAQWKRPRKKATAYGRGVARTTPLRAVGAKLGSRLPAPARRPGAQGELARNGQPFVLPIKAGRGRKTKPFSSSGVAVAKPARRRRSNGSHDRSGSLRHEE